MSYIIILLFLFAGIFTSLVAYAAENEKFAVYYSDVEPVESFKNYSLLVLDSRYHPPLKALSQDGKILLGYISLGEIEQKTPYFSLMKKGGILLKENENWKGSYGVDIRDPLWQKTVIENMIPELLRDGFDGIFIDTLDGPLELERSAPKNYPGMADAAVKLIKGIRLHYPNIKIMLNRAYAILPKVAPHIDMELGESVRTTYNFNNKSYISVAEADYLLQVGWLKDVQARNKNLRVYTLDYSDKNDIVKISDVYRIQRENGFVPYVTTISLNELVEEPIVVSGGTK